MFLESNFTEFFDKADTQCKEKLCVALAGIEPENPDLSFEMIDDLYDNDDYLGKVFYIQKGALTQVLDGKTLFHHDAGDIIGLDVVDGAPRSTFKSESPVTLRPFDRETLWQAANANAEKAKQWCEYLLAECGRHSCVIASLDLPADKASLGFKTFSPGEVIIEEGTQSDTVYSIVEGHAEVFVNGTKVGEVLEDEIFGAMSLLTNSPRTATVVADAHCLVMVVPKDQFHTLIQTHPQICLSLMENMARQIVALNQQVASAQDV